MFLRGVYDCHVAACLSVGGLFLTTFSPNNTSANNRAYNRPNNRPNNSGANNRPNNRPNNGGANNRPNNSGANTSANNRTNTAKHIKTHHGNQFVNSFGNAQNGNIYAKDTNGSPRQK